MGSFELAQLSTDGRGRDIQRVAGMGDATLSGDDPEVVQVVIVERDHDRLLAIKLSKNTNKSFVHSILFNV